MVIRRTLRHVGASCLVSSEVIHDIIMFIPFPNESAYQGKSNRSIDSRFCAVESKRSGTKQLLDSVLSLSNRVALSPILHLTLNCRVNRKLVIALVVIIAFVPISELSFQAPMFVVAPDGSCSFKDLRAPISRYVKPKGSSKVIQVLRSRPPPFSARAKEKVTEKRLGSFG